MVISITFQITRNIRCSNPTLAAISSPVRGAIFVEPPANDPQPRQGRHHQDDAAPTELGFPIRT